MHDVISLDKDNAGGSKTINANVDGTIYFTGIDRLHLYFRLIVSVTEEARSSKAVVNNYTAR